MTSPRILILFCLVFFFHGLIQANTYFTINGYVHHFNRTDRWNEGLNNNIIGFEYEFTETSSVELTKFINSFKNDAFTVNYNHRWPVDGASDRADPEAVRQYLSLKLGLAEGYDPGIGFFIFPTYVTKWDSYQIDVHVLPALYVVFFKVRF